MSYTAGQPPRGRPSLFTVCFRQFSPKKRIVIKKRDLLVQPKLHFNVV